MSISGFQKAFEHIQISSNQWNDWAHRLYLTSNECQRKKTQEELRHLSVNGNTVIGVSGLELLNFASLIFAKMKTPRRYIILLDRGIRTELFFKSLETIIKQSSTKEDAVKKIAQNVWEKRFIYYANIESKYVGNDEKTKNQKINEYTKLILEIFKKDILNNLSFFSSKERFLTIKNVFDQNHFIFKRLDFSEFDSIKKIINPINSQKLTIDLLYISNIIELLDNDALVSTIRSICILINTQTKLITTNYRTCFTCEPLEQKICEIFPEEKKSDHLDLVKRQLCEAILKDKYISFCICNRPPKSKGSKFDRDKTFVEVDLHDYNFKFRLPWKFFIEIISHKGLSEVK